MQTKLVLKPGQGGTKKLLDEYGERLVCVRYRYDAAKRKRYKTVELIVDEVDWNPLPSPEEVVGVRVVYGEYELGKRVRQAGGVWNRERQLWEMRYQDVIVLGLEERVVRENDGVYEAGEDL